MNIWFTSDEHYGHRRIIEFCDRPFESVQHMNEEMIRLHNSRVSPADLVIHVGDFSFSPVSVIRQLLQRLNGRHILVIGNHDKGGIKSHTDAGFLFSCYELGLRIAGEKVIVKHYPYRKSIWWQIKRFFRGQGKLKYWERRPIDSGYWLIHGHTHSKTQVHELQINVAVDAWDFRPVSINEIERIITKGRKTHEERINWTY